MQIVRLLKSVVLQLACPLHVRGASIRHTALSKDVPSLDMKQLDRKLRLVYFTAAIPLLLCPVDTSSQERRILKPGVETYDSLVVQDEDTVRVLHVAKNHLMGVEILGDIDEVEPLLDHPPVTSSWKTYRNTAFHVSFQYPPEFEVKTVPDESGTNSLLLMRHPLGMSATKSRNVASPAMSIQLGDFSLSKAAEDVGFALRDDVWCTEGRAILEATVIKGDTWFGLVGENAYGAELDGGGIGLAYDQSLFLFKNIAPNLSATCSDPDITLDVAVTIFASLRHDR